MTEEKAKKEEIEHADPNDLVMEENSRFRADENLNELIETIKQHGILQPIVVRREDNRIIMGNRRTAAAIKLGLNFVPVIFKSNISDKECDVLNLIENMQRKDITTIEIGRRCDIMLKNNKYKTSIQELATLLGKPSTRIKNCIDIFKKLPPKWRDKVVHVESSMSRKFGELPENVATAVIHFNSNFKPITDAEMDIFYEKVASDKMTIADINLIGRLYQEGISFRKALKEHDSYVLSRFNFIALKTEMADAMKKEKAQTKNELIIKIVKNRYPNLFY